MSNPVLSVLSHSPLPAVVKRATLERFASKSGNMNIGLPVSDKHVAQSSRWCFTSALPVELLVL